MQFYYYYFIVIYWTPVYTRLQARAHGSTGSLNSMKLYSATCSGKYKEKQLCQVLLVSLLAV